MTKIDRALVDRCPIRGWIRIVAISLVMATSFPVYAETELEKELRGLVRFTDNLLGNRSVQSKISSGKPAVKRKYHSIIQNAARRNRLDPWLLHAIIQHESAYDCFAESAKGAQGLMQLMPDTQRELGVTNPWNPNQNINGGAIYYRRMLEKFKGSYRNALLAYNAGPGKILRGVIPKESRRYASNVMDTWQRLKK